MNTTRDFRSPAMKTARVVLLLAILPLSALASQIDITITGLVASGTDISGVFGPANSDLTGDAFSLVFTFDDTKGSQTTATCGGGVPDQTTIASTPTSNPGTAALTISGDSFTFGVLNAAFEATQRFGDPMPPRPSAASPARFILRRATGFSLMAAALTASSIRQMVRS